MGEGRVGAKRGWKLENRGGRVVGGRRTIVTGIRGSYKKNAQYCVMLKSRTRGGNH